MRLFVMFGALVAAFSVQAQGVQRAPQNREVVLITRTYTMATGTNFGGRVIGHPARVTKMDGVVSSGGGGGAGNTVVTITDGTNTCTFTFACSGTTATGTVFSASAVNGAGTGCVYAAGASLSGSVTTAGCTTTQPGMNLNIVGVWR